MNERIRQLAKEAGFMPDNFISRWEDEFEKFAQLIVQECVKVCADRGKHHDGLYSAWANDCSERVGKHFGVEQ